MPCIKDYSKLHTSRYIGLCDAIRLYGSENVSFFPPNYEKEGQCPWCGGEVKSKRRRYCSDKCRTEFQNMTVWYRGRSAYSYKIMVRDNFTCQDCGEIHNFINEYGMTIPIDDGQLEVHHIVPLSQGGGNNPTNLITLCKACHKARHDKMRFAESEE